MGLRTYIGARCIASHLLFSLLIQLVRRILIVATEQSQLFKPKLVRSRLPSPKSMMRGKCWRTRNRSSRVLRLLSGPSTGLRYTRARFENEQSCDCVLWTWWSRKGLVCEALSAIDGRWRMPVEQTKSLQERQRMHCANVVTP